MNRNNPTFPGAARYLEDIQVGDHFSTASYAMHTARIKAFAKEFDPQSFHLDEVAAQASLFGGLAASGWHTAAVTMKLLVTGNLNLAGGMIGTSVEVSWPTPTRADDILHVESEVVAVETSRSRPDRGIVTLRSETLNQDGKVVQKMLAKVLVWQRSTINNGDK
jgi:acyl dehydratase